VGFYVGHLACANALRWLSRAESSSAPSAEALIDTSHLSRCNLDLWQPDGLGGLVQNLMRKNYMPVVTTRFSPELIGRSKVVFLVAPAERFGSAELAIYERFVRNGGQLFVSVGYEDVSGCKELLSRFGLGLRNLPLGPVAKEANDAKAWFLNAWPVTFESAVAEAICKRGEYPLIVATRYHRGKVVVIGDSGFFLNRNLELPYDFNPENITFLRKLIPNHE
jgi:hypothetical protein